MTRMTRRQFAATAAAAAAAAKLGPTTAFAQENYPTRPIQLICPWGAGGGTDATARIVAALLERDFGRHHHGRDRDDALARADRAHAEELHAACPDELGPARHPGQIGLALQDG